MSSLADRIRGYWQKPEVLNRLPQVRRDFDQNRDPMIAAQMQDNKKTEAQRRRDQAKQVEQAEAKQGRGSKMVRQDHPHPAPHPTGPMAQEVDRAAFRERWLAEQRDAAFAQAVEQKSSFTLSREMARASRSPSR